MASETLHMHCSSIHNGLADGIRLCDMNYTMPSEVWHFHDFYELVFVINGEGLHCTKSGKQAIGRGSVFLIRPGEAHGYADLKRLSIINVLYLSEKLFLPLTELRRLNGFLSFFEAIRGVKGDIFVLQLNDEEISTAELLLERMDQEQNQQKTGYLIALNALLWELFLLISRVADRETQEFPPELTPLYSYCNSHLNTGLRVQDLAAYCYLSVRSLERLLQRTQGVTPALFLQNLKLKHAANLLLTSNRKIVEVAEESGFSDAGYFTRVFRKFYGVTPMQYRQQQLPPPSGRS